MMASEHSRRQVYACYWFEETAPQRLLDKIGVDNVLFETDPPDLPLRQCPRAGRGLWISTRRNVREGRGCGWSE